MNDHEQDIINVKLRKMLLPEQTPDAQMRAVTGGGDLVTVGAGAGTGKTWVLSARFANLLFSEPARLPQEILTLTYTEAAAREMQERIKKRVLELLHGLNLSPDRIQSISDGLDETWISTIHAFAARLIKESGLALDIDPNSVIISGPQEDRFWNSFERALDSIDLVSFVGIHQRGKLLELAAELDSDAALSSLLEKWPPAEIARLARDVIELHSSLGSDWNSLLAMASDAQKEEDPQVIAMMTQIRGLLSPRWEEAWQLWSGIFKSFGDRIAADSTTRGLELAELMQRWSHQLKEPVPDAEGLRSFFVDVVANAPAGTGKLFKGEDGIDAFIGASVSDWRKKNLPWYKASDFDGKAPFSREEQQTRALLLRLCALAWGTLESVKQRQGLLSFSDLIRYAMSSIEKSERLKGFAHVMVDEFQDTDPLQDKVLTALREKEQAKLFLVGDPKQSIYAFRHADLSLFADYMLQSEKLGTGVTLDISFRTRPALLKELNSLFSSVWANGLGADAKLRRLKFEPLSPPEHDQPARNEASIPPLSLILAAAHGRSRQAEREAVFKSLAQKFKHWVTEQHTVWDKDLQKLRPVQWKDFAVLTPTRTTYTKLEDTFKALKIPVILEKSKNYFSRGEVTDFISLLRAVAFSRDETALAGWIASPFSGLVQHEAYTCLQKHAAVYKTSKASLFDVLSKEFPETADRFHKLCEIGSVKGPAALLASLLDDRRWLTAYKQDYRLRVMTNLTSAIASAESYESSISSSMAGCALWLDAAMRGSMAQEEPNWNDDDADAVHVMTVHASKGLEFPIVAIVNAEGSKNKNCTLLHSKELGVALSKTPTMLTEAGQAQGEAVACLSLLWEQILSQQKRLEESSRLFYVAATRARDSLILCGTVSEDPQAGKKVTENSWLDWTLQWLAKENDCQWQDLRDPRLEYISVSEAEPSAALVDTKAVLELPLTEEVAEDKMASIRCVMPSLHSVTLASLSATSFALFDWCPLAWRRRHRQGLDLTWEIPDALNDDDMSGVGGADLGSLAHWLLAHWDMDEETLAPWLCDHTTRQRLPASLRVLWDDQKNKDALQTWLAAFIKSPAGLSIGESLRGGRLRRELKFNAGLGETRLTGAMDVLWHDAADKNLAGLWHLRDYKITRMDNAPAELYRSQLFFYALAVKLLADKSGLPFEGIDMGLIFLREGGLLGESMTFSQNYDWQLLKDKVNTAALAAASGPWLPERTRCQRCPWRKSCHKAQ